MPTKAELSKARATGRANTEAVAAGALVGAASAPVAITLANELPTMVSPEWDRAIVGAATIAVGAAIPTRHRAAKYAAYASGAVMVGTAIADLLLGPEGE